MGFTVGDYLSIGASILGNAYEAEAKTAQYKEQIKQLVKQRNFDVQNINLQRRDLYEQLVGQIVKTRMNMQGLAGSVSANLNETLSAGGRTAGLIERSLQADESRAVSSMQDVYTKKSAELNANIEMANENLSNQISNTPRPRFDMWSTISNLATAFGVYSQAKHREDMLSINGMETDLWGRVKMKPQGYASVNLPDTSRNWWEPLPSMVSQLGVSDNFDWLGKNIGKNQYPFDLNTHWTGHYKGYYDMKG